MDTGDLVRRARKLARLREKAAPGPWKTRRIFMSDQFYIMGTRRDEYIAANAGEQDALLIAAAPKMAELLEQLVEAFRDGLSEYGQHRPTCPRASVNGDEYFRVVCTCGFDALRDMNPQPEDTDAGN